MPRYILGPALDVPDKKLEGEFQSTWGGFHECISVRSSLRLSLCIGQDRLVMLQ